LRAIDGPFLAIDDAEGLLAAATRAAELGFDGKWAIHPSQVPIANEVFAPTAEQIAAARDSIEVYRASERDGVGAIGRGGQLVDAAHMRHAATTLHRAALAGLLERA
jgi:citrate lyase subunit beta/citryl-CoA lyase